MSAPSPAVPRRSSDARRRLAQRILSAAKLLMQDHGGAAIDDSSEDQGADATVLLGLRKACDSTLRGTADPLTVFVAFTLSALIADLSRNLFVDAQYSPSLERGRVELLRRTADSLGLVGSALEIGIPIAVAAALSDLVHFYNGLLTRLIDLEEARYGYAT